jgi:hypothetical protein
MQEMDDEHLVCSKFKETFEQKSCDHTGFLLVQQTDYLMKELVV